MDKFNFDRVGKNFQKVKTALPKVLANQAQNYFHKSFKDQGFDGTKWKEVNRRIEGTNEWKYPKNKGLGRRTKSILSGSGALDRAVGNSIRAATFDMVSIVVALEYAEAHNDGNPKRNLPKRQFIGQTRTLTNMQDKKIDEYIQKTWQE